MFSDKEVDYLKSQKLARIATVSAKGQPDVAPVSFEFDGQHIYVGGITMTTTLKYKNVLNGNKKIAIVFDDLEEVTPWRPRGIKIHGSAEIVERKGQLGEGAYLRITPEKYWSWGIERPVFEDGKIIMKRESL